jgi:cytochrome c1
VGPNLDGVANRRDPTFLKSWLENPALVKPDSKMPKLPLTKEEITELVAFLSQLKEGK